MYSIAKLEQLDGKSEKAKGFAIEAFDLNGYDVFNNTFKVRFYIDEEYREPIREVNVIALAEWFADNYWKIMHDGCVISKEESMLNAASFAWQDAHCLRSLPGDWNWPDIVFVMHDSTAYVTPADYSQQICIIDYGFGKAWRVNKETFSRAILSFCARIYNRIPANERESTKLHEKLKKLEKLRSDETWASVKESESYKNLKTEQEPSAETVDQDSMLPKIGFTTALIICDGLLKVYKDLRDVREPTASKTLCNRVLQFSCIIEVTCIAAPDGGHSFWAKVKPYDGQQYSEENSFEAQSSSLEEAILNLRRQIWNEAHKDLN